MSTRILTTTALALALAAGLTGCSGSNATSETRPTRTPAPTGITTAPPPELEKASVRCSDGVARVADLNNKEVTVPDCAKVRITTSNARIIMGDADELRVTGAINSITANDVASITVTGDANEITTTSKPEIDDSGAKNVVNH